MSTEHPEGAIQMRIGSRVLLDERHWDAIDLLWIELLETCKCVAARRSYSFYFPDQPLEFAVDFEPRKGEVALRVGGERAAVTSRGEFLAVMLRAGSHAMKQLSRIVPRGESRFQRYLTDLQTLEAGLRDGL